MRFFERPFERSVKKDGEGRTVFFPWGFLGRGRILDGATELRARKLEGIYNAAWAVTLLTAVFLVPEEWNTPVLLAALCVMPAVYYFFSERILAGSPVSDIRITWREQAYKVHWSLPVIVLLCSFLMLYFVALGFFNAASAGQRTGVAAAGLFFLALMILSGYILVSAPDPAPGEREAGTQKTVKDGE